MKRSTIPAWLTASEEKMGLLHMGGSKTEWLVDVLKSGKLEVMIRGWKTRGAPRWQGTFRQANGPDGGLQGSAGRETWEGTPHR